MALRQLHLVTVRQLGYRLHQGLVVVVAQLQVAVARVIEVVAVLLQAAAVIREVVVFLLAEVVEVVEGDRVRAEVLHLVVHVNH